MRAALTCVVWQVTLCDPIWQVTSHSSEVPLQEYLYRPLPLLSIGLAVINCDTLSVFKSRLKIQLFNTAYS